MFLRHDRGADRLQREHRLLEELRRAVADVGPRSADLVDLERMADSYRQLLGIVKSYAPE